jgi:hypothetical protein
MKSPNLFTLFVSENTGEKKRRKKKKRKRKKTERQRERRLKEIGKDKNSDRTNPLQRSAVVESCWAWGWGDKKNKKSDHIGESAETPQQDGSSKAFSNFSWGLVSPRAQVRNVCIVYRVS